MPSPRGMLPEIRAAYKQALAELRAVQPDAKPLYHFSRDPESLLVNPKSISTGDVSTFEPWKPPALYASDSLIDNMASTIGESGLPPKTYVSQMGGADQFARIVPKPNARVYETSESSLQNLLGRMNTKYGRPTHAEVNQVEGRGKDVWDRIFRNKDIVRIKGVDEDPELVENLITNPKAVRIFSKDKAWLPAALAALGISQADNAEAITLPQAYRQALRAVMHEGGAKFSDMHPQMKQALRTTVKGVHPKIWEEVPRIRAKKQALQDAAGSGLLNDEATKDFLQFASKAHDVNGFMMSGQYPPFKQAGVGNTIYLGTKNPHHVLAHEVGHTQQHKLTDAEYDKLKSHHYTGMSDWVQGNTGTSIHHPNELFAELAAHKIQGKQINGVLPLKDLMSKYFPALAAMGVTAGSLGLPEDADAAPIKAVREMMKKMQAQGGKTFFHYSPKPEKLLTEGVIDPLETAIRKENHKPWAFYMADQVKKIPGHLTGGYTKTDTSKRLKEYLRGSHTSPIVRVVTKPDARIRTIAEPDMQDYNRELSKIRADLAALEGGPKVQLPVRDEDLTQHWQDVADILQIKDVDLQRGVSEYLNLNPNKIGGLFWENQVWTPETGMQVLGEPNPTRVPKKTLGPKANSFANQPYSVLDENFNPLAAPPGSELFNEQMLGDRLNTETAELLGINAAFSKPNLLNMADAYPKYQPASGPDWMVDDSSNIYKIGLGALMAGGGLVGGASDADAMPRVFRAEANTRRLLKEGFQEMHPDGEVPWSSVKPEGLYWIERLRDLGRMYGWDEMIKHPKKGSHARGQVAYLEDEVTDPGDYASLLSGRTTPEAKIRTTTEQALTRLARTKGRQFPDEGSYKGALTDYLKFKYDFLRVKDLDGKEGLKELIQLNPGKVKLSTGQLLGIGALAAGGALSSEPAEALPIGKLNKLNPKIMSHPRSEDAFYRLIGHKLRDGHEVIDIRKHPKNDWRYVITKDADGKLHQLPMTKDYINVFAGAKGTQDYLQQFRGEGYQGKKLQSLKSLGRREATREATSQVSTKDFKAWNKGQMEKARQIDPKLVNDYVYVKSLNEVGGPVGQELYMPREYADFLAAKGYVKILKR